MERHAPRDLHGLWALAERGHIDAEAVEVFVRSGPTGRPPAAWVFDAAPDEDAWRRALGHQTRLRVTAEAALGATRDAWMNAVQGG